MFLMTKKKLELKHQKKLGFFPNRVALYIVVGSNVLPDMKEKVKFFRTKNGDFLEIFGKRYLRDYLELEKKRKISRAIYSSRSVHFRGLLSQRSGLRGPSAPVFHKHN